MQGTIVSVVDFVIASYVVRLMVLCAAISASILSWNRKVVWYYIGQSV